MESPVQRITKALGEKFTPNLSVFRARFAVVLSKYPNLKRLS